MHSQLMQLREQPQHVAVICGGAVSGSEAAAACVERGMTAVVIEQNARPYGKIEDGLPRWHDKLRTQEYERIDTNLKRPGVLYVPSTRIGVDLSFERVLKGWSPSVLFLANGAWRDRPLPVRADIDHVDLERAGLVYQNSFVYWFNHCDEPGYQGPNFSVSDNAIVVGGGLASVDVAKIINIELCRRALRDRGIHVSVVDVEHKGIRDTLGEHALSAEAIGLSGCTLYYRRRVRDMPLTSPKNDSPEQLAKTEQIREKMVAILREKFHVRVQDCAAPVSPILEGGKLKGLVFRRTEHKDGKAVEIEGSDFEARAELVISSSTACRPRASSTTTRAGVPAPCATSAACTAWATCSPARATSKTAGSTPARSARP
jgi:ferredoxin--NADP+ reductase